MKLVALSALLSIALMGSALAEPKKLNDAEMDGVAAGALVNINVNVSPQINTAVLTQTAVATSIANAICAVCIRAQVTAASGATGSNLGGIGQVNH